MSRRVTANRKSTERLGEGGHRGISICAYERLPRFLSLASEIVAASSTPKHGTAGHTQQDAPCAPPSTSFPPRGVSSPFVSYLREEGRYRKLAATVARLQAGPVINQGGREGGEEEGGTKRGAFSASRCLRFGSRIVPSYETSVTRFSAVPALPRPRAVTNARTGNTSRFPFLPAAGCSAFLLLLFLFVPSLLSSSSRRD